MQNKAVRILYFAWTLIVLFVSPSHMAIAAEPPGTLLSEDELHAYSELSERIKENYINPVDDKTLFNACLSGMASGIDSESAYLNPEAFIELQRGQNLGLELSIERNYPVVIAPVEDGPAYDAGVRSGDVIVKVDDFFARGMSLEDVKKRLSGEPDTKVKLTLKRKGESQPIVLTLTRARSINKSVKSKLIAPNIAYIRITQFQEKTGRDLAKAIESLLEQNRKELKGIILDLRNNPGGLLNTAVAVSAAFLGRDMLVLYTEGRTDNAKMRLTTAPRDYYGFHGVNSAIKTLPPFVKTIPLVVLVNNGSAAASEIVAGALQDYKRATIMGVPTFGKSTIQTILPLKGQGKSYSSAVKLTTAHWFTPKGRSVQPDGIVPDVVIDGPTDMPAQAAINSDTQLVQALTFIKTSSGQ